MNGIINAKSLYPEKKEMNIIDIEVKAFVQEIRKTLSKNRIKADAFLGGSYAKGTMMKQDKYDIDIYVRFDLKYNGISDILEKILKKTGLPFSRIHGSRDYFQIKKKSWLVFEVIPVKKVNKPSQSENVTDLSYFHVNYVQKNASDKLRKEILVMKAFCVAQNVYGAESYIRGFSGYAVECLVIYYKSFLKTIKTLSKSKDKLFIDGGRNYRNLSDIEINMNESKRKSPVVFVDPTYKERNVLSALSDESFLKFKKACLGFLKNPSKKYFEMREFDLIKFQNEAKKKKAELLKILLETDKQPGDIAGAKLVKCAGFIEQIFSRYFIILKKEFIYNEGKEAHFYLIAKPKKEVLLNGPPLSMEKQAKIFRKAHKSSYVKSGRLYTSEKVPESAKSYLKNYISKNKKQFEEKSIVSIKIG